LALPHLSALPPRKTAFGAGQEKIAGDSGDTKITHASRDEADAIGKFAIRLSVFGLSTITDPHFAASPGRPSSPFFCHVKASSPFSILDSGFSMLLSSIQYIHPTATTQHYMAIIRTSQT